MTRGIRKSIGDGKKTLFWHDPWLDSKPLKKMFPRLFLLAINQNSYVESQGFWEGYNWIWNFEWKRSLRVQDLAEKVNLDSILKKVCPAYESGDKLIWVFDKSDKFSTKSFSSELAKLQPLAHHDAIKGVWKGLVPHRIEVFTWTALLGKINTRHKLASIGIIPSADDLCPLCLSSQETSDHLLLLCPFSQNLWAWWLGLWDLKWVFPNSLKEAFEQWVSPKKFPFFKKVWAAMFFIIIWSVWKERNLLIFGSTCTSAKNLQDLMLLRLGWWITGWNDGFPYYPLDIQRNPECLL